MAFVTPAMKHWLEQKNSYKPKQTRFDILIDKIVNSY